MITIIIAQIKNLSRLFRKFAAIILRNFSMIAGEQCCDLCVDGVFKEFFVMAARKSPHTKGSFENCAITCQHNFKLNAREQILSLKAFTVRTRQSRR